MTKCLIAEYETSVAAKVGLETLERDDFTLDHVSVVSKASDPAAGHLEGLHDEAEGQSAAPHERNTSLGMLIGGSIAAPIAAGTLVGPLIVAGPLVGMAVGATIGSLITALEHRGVTHDVTADYESRVKKGSILVVVHDVSESRLGDAEVLLKETSPQTLERYEVD